MSKSTELILKIRHLTELLTLGVTPTCLDLIYYIKVLSYLLRNKKFILSENNLKYRQLYVIISQMKCRFGVI